MQTSENINELAAALAKAQATVKGALKDATNPHFKASYADLASVWDACREAITGNGIAIVQAPSSSDDGSVCVTTRMVHSSGQWVETAICCRPMKNDAQGLGSVITYLRRYSLAAMVGVAPEDDDGEGGVGVGRGKAGGEKMDPTGAPKTKNSRDPGWNGPLSKTALREAQRALLKALGKVQSTDEAEKIKAEFGEVIEQTKIDLPSDWTGSDDADGLEEEIARAITRALDPDRIKTREYLAAIAAATSREEAGKVLTASGYDDWLADFRKRRKVEADATSLAINKALNERPTVLEAA